MGSTVGGTYTLLVAVADPAEMAVGSLGTVEFPAGHYAYTGSALGPGGFARVDRHREVAAGERAVAQWHVDYLLGLPGAGVVAAVRSPGSDAECTVVGRIDVDGVEAPAVEGFGATDCGCRGHLAYAPARVPLYEAVWRAHVAVGNDTADPGGP